MKSQAIELTASAAGVAGIALAIAAGLVTTGTPLVAAGAGFMAAGVAGEFYAQHQARKEQAAEEACADIASP